MAFPPIATEHPQLRLTSGAQLPPGLRLTHQALTRSPRALRRQLLRVASRWPGERLPEMIASYPDGRRFLVPAGDRMYSQLFLYGAWEPDESLAFRGLLRPGDFVVDGGANFGWFSLLAASLCGPGGQVWAIEPLPAAIEGLRANLELNPGLPIRHVEAALGESDGEVTLHSFTGLLHGHSSTSRMGRSDYVEHRVPRRSLDSLLAGDGAEPALVKLDLEGAEKAALAGASALIAAERPPIWMLEVNADTSLSFGYQPADLLAPFRDDGRYEVLRLEGTGLVPERDPASAPHGVTWFCIPAARRERLI